MRIVAWAIGMGLLLLLDCAAAQPYLGNCSAKHDGTLECTHRS